MRIGVHQVAEGLARWRRTASVRTPPTFVPDGWEQGEPARGAVACGIMTLGLLGTTIVNLVDAERNLQLSARGYATTPGDGPSRLGMPPSTAAKGARSIVHTWTKQGSKECH